MPTTKIALAAALVAALVSGAALSASAEARAAQNAQSSTDNVIPGYGKDGGHVAIPNPDR